ncbi:MAG: uroporphyrinogen-III C-methyltransferase [Dysgonamonadaceae bacterium]|jgi:uroporphyrinogen III methyltransferase/synthase|nr:uroporphyrinogen-III C-methyltransferase [Dysgonamonadaceae bacterium]
MIHTLTVTSRKTPLSNIQVEEALAAFPSVKYCLHTVESFGDKNKHISLLTDAVAPDFFTREQDEILLNNRADIAVHSAKDLPYPLPSELEVYALLEAEDKTDALVSRDSLTLEQLPSESRIGTSSAARKAEVLQYRPDLQVVGIRGSIEERIAQVDNGFVDALIVATCALKRLGLTGRITQVLPFRTHPLQGNLAITGRKDRPELKAFFSPKDIRRQYGRVTLVGFGPGNPDLLTLAGDKALAAADVIFHDDLLDRDFLLHYPAEKVYVGKRKGRHHYQQDEINDLLYHAAIAGKNAVRLKGGDPMIFAHGREEIDFLQSSLICVNVIPGISSGIALAACTHIPLTHRGLASSVAFITGHDEEKVQIPDADTLVYYMGGFNIARIARKLIAAGRREDLPVALVHNVSLPEQRTYYSTLKELQYSIICYPTPILIVAGEVVALEHHAARKDCVLLTGTSGKDYQQDAHVTHTPLIGIRKCEENTRLHAIIKGIRSVDWIIFTSRYGVRYFFEAFDELQADVRALSAVRLASVGQTTTSELNKHRIQPDMESETASAEGIIRYFAATGVTNKQILLPRSDRGLKTLPEALEKLGNKVLDIPVYCNTVNEKAKKTDLSRFQKIIFSSPSGVEAFGQLYGGFPSGIQLVAKGKTTEKKLRSNIYSYSNETVSSL